MLDDLGFRSLSLAVATRSIRQYDQQYSPLRKQLWIWSQEDRFYTQSLDIAKLGVARFAERSSISISRSREQRPPVGAKLPNYQTAAALEVRYAEHP